jgi:quercetin dioxygenase-like cupin family protein
MVVDPVLRQRYEFNREGDVMVVEVWAEAGSQVPDHLHPAQVERWEVVEGEATFYVDGRGESLGAGGRVSVERGRRHRFEVSPSGPARLRAEVEPALDIEGFLTDGAALNGSGRYTARGIPKGLRAAIDAAAFLKRYEQTTVVLSPPRIIQRLFVLPLARFARSSARL